MDVRNARPVIEEHDTVRMVGEGNTSCGVVEGFIPSKPVDRILVRWPNNRLQLHWPEELAVVIRYR